MIVTGACLPYRDELTLATPALLYILPVGLAALVGGRAIAVVVALVTAVTYSLAFIPPTGSLRVKLREDLVSLVVLLAVALTVGTLVARESARRRQAEQREGELAVLYAEYQRTVADRERLAAEARRVEVLEEVDRQRRALLRSVSHDLRTPLATIRTITSGIRGGTPYDPETRDELLDLVGREIDRLDRFVSNLLSLSRIEAGALQPSFQPTDLGEVITQAVDRLHDALRAHTVEVHAAHLPAVPADGTQLDLVLTNLLENAARHAPAGTVIRIDATVEGDVVRLVVADHGPGIDASVVPTVFDAFTTGAGGSTGIGLATCKAIVEAHGGTIVAGETIGGGASFTVSIPLRR